jgi:hypothetical protein
MEMARLYTAAEELQRLLRIFSSNFGMPEASTIRRTQWHESVIRLGQKATGAVTGAAIAVADGAASVPRAIGGAVEDTILHVAQGIEERRAVPAETTDTESESETTGDAAATR